MRELTAFKSHTGQSSIDRGRGVRFGAFAVVLAITMPRLLRSFSPAGDPLDTSWAWMLGYALQNHLQWGESIVFTYGPLGFLTHPYFYADHMLWALAATVRLASWLAFGLGFTCILRRLAPADRPLPGPTLPVAIGWIIGASFLDLSSQSAIMGVLLLVLAIREEDSTASVIELALSGSLLALGALIKSTALIVSLFALLVYPVLWRYAARPKDALHLPLLPLLSASISFCALWSISAQSLAHLPAYFRGTWEIVRGYTTAMSVTGMRIQILSALAILALLAGTLMGLHASGRKVRVAQGWLLAGLAFWAWKEGFTLQDPGYFRHPMTFYGTALLIASAGALLLPSGQPGYLRTCLYGAYAIALFSSMLGYPPSSLTYTNVLDNYKSYVALISSRSRRVREQRTQTAAIRTQFEIPEGVVNAIGHASVNVMPWSLMMTQGESMRLVANPVMQSYSAYTPYLDQLNARQIWDGTSADKIIFSYAALGYRYPPFDDPATFRALLTCYRTERPDATYLLLTHVACARPEMLPADVPQVAGFGKWIRVPLKASYVGIDLSTTIIGDLANVAYKADHVWILFGLADGLVAGPFQLIYPVARDGLFIRYFIGSNSDIGRLFSGNASGMQRIAAIQIVTGPRSLDFAKHFRVRFLYENPPHGYLANASERHSGSN